MSTAGVVTDAKNRHENETHMSTNAKGGNESELVSLHGVSPSNYDDSLSARARASAIDEENVRHDY